jgi:predicted phosphohydrolase
MASITWCTDLHLDHVDDKKLISFAESLNKSKSDFILFTGDISNSTSVTYKLSAIEHIVKRPLYFVLGNHDYYGSSVEVVRKQMHDLTNVAQYLRYLPTHTYSRLTDNVALVGHDCWYDAGYGNLKQTKMIFNDWIMIKEYAGTINRESLYNVNADYKKVVDVSQKLAHQGVIHIFNGLKDALKDKKIRKVLIASHVPAYLQSHMYEGKLGDDTAHPWFLCKMLSKVIDDACSFYPDRQFVLLSGHTHGRYKNRIRENLEVMVGDAEYGNPKIESVITI